MALAAVLAGEAEVVLGNADLAQGVEVAEGHPQEALVHLQQVLLARQTEERTERLIPRMGLQAPRGFREGREAPTNQISGFRQQQKCVLLKRSQISTIARQDYLYCVLFHIDML